LIVGIDGDGRENDVDQPFEEIPYLQNGFIVSSKEEFSAVIKHGRTGGTKSINIEVRKEIDFPTSFSDLNSPAASSSCAALRT